MVSTVIAVAAFVAVSMGADFCAAQGEASIQWLYSTGTVWLAAASAEFAAIDQAQADGMVGVVAGAAVDILAAASVIPGAGIAAAFTAGAGTLTDGG